jgi:hypothetical protein
MFSLKNYASLTLPKDWLSNYILQLWKQNHWSNYLHVHPQKKTLFCFPLSLLGFWTYGLTIARHKPSALLTLVLFWIGSHIFA